MQCKKCGAVVKSTYRYCPACGKRCLEPRDQFIVTQRRARREFINLRQREDKYASSCGKLAEAAWVSTELRLELQKKNSFGDWNFDDPAQEAQAYQVLEDTKVQAAELFDHLMEYIAG